MLQNIVETQVKQKLRAKLVDRGYPESPIMTTILEIRFEDRKLALQHKSKEIKRLLSTVLQKWHLIQQQPATWRNI